MSKDPRLYRIIQWVVFAPILLPVCLVVGTVDGIQKLAGAIVQQIKAIPTP